MLALVTGGNGHLGFNLVRALHARGYRVRATVRSVTDASKVAALQALGRVELAEADVRDPQSMSAALRDIDTLFHLAAVYSTTEPGRHDEILDAALRGTETTLRAAAAAGVRRVIMTSSVVTLPLTEPGAPPATERDWTSDLRVPYFRAKVESERRAWALADELGLSLATILPAGIIGPGFVRNTPTIDIVEASLLGEFRLGVPTGNFGLVDARDAAEAHVLAAETRALGRLIVAYDQMPTFGEIVRALAALDVSVKLPLVTLPRLFAPVLPIYDALSHRVFGTPRIATPELVATAVSGKVWNYSNQRARTELGWTPKVPLEESLRDTVRLLRARHESA